MTPSMTESDPFATSTLVCWVCAHSYPTETMVVDEQHPDHAYICFDCDQRRDPDHAEA